MMSPQGCGPTLARGKPEGSLRLCAAPNGSRAEGESPEPAGPRRRVGTA
jgi:hypothetical protein